jgi:hypothetical protein
MTNEVASGTQSSIQVPESNKTSLGLYVTPEEAYAMWEANPEGVHILDVRTFEGVSNHELILQNGHDRQGR